MFTLLIHTISHTIQREYGTLDRALSAAQAALEQGHPVQLLPAAPPQGYDEAP